MPLEGLPLHAALNEARGLAPMAFFECMEEDSVDDQAQLLVSGRLHALHLPEEDGDASGVCSAIVSDADGESSGSGVPVTAAAEAAATESFEVRLFKRKGATFGMALNIMRDGLLGGLTLRTMVCPVREGRCIPIPHQGSFG